ncbi:MAG TPA: gliding motility-associated C-terminal domain-containing protein [Flavobacteriales bacterium]|nr:gliding motility-associated C-terminal domain-containing protein [Flavobacteriales bacterium]
MIKRLLVAGSFLLLTHFNNFGQDLALQAPFGSFSAPVTGCSLTSTETVTVNLVAFGTNLPAGTTFDVSFSVNNVVIATESVTLAATLLANSTYIHTFAATANLSVAGTYDLDATVTLTSVADINTSNDTYSNYSVTNNAASFGGTVSGGTNVCNGSNSGNVTLSGHTGTVVSWEYSTDGGTIFIPISNTTTTQTYNNLTVPTLYRAVVNNAGCGDVPSTSASMTIDAVSVGGTITGATQVCITSNSGTLTSTGKTGVVLDWQSAPAAGGPYTSLGHAGNTHAYAGLTATTFFRVSVQNNSCPAVFSGVKTLTVNPASVGGSVSTSDTVCASGNAGSLNIAGETGTRSWQSSTDGITFSTILPANATASQAYTNLSSTMYYRVRVTSGVCAATFSDTAIITVDPATSAGSLSSNATLCSGSNSGTLNLAGSLGSILNWESSTDGGVVWTPIANTTTSENYLNLLSTTLYRTQVKSGVCAAKYSDTITLTVDSTTLGGTLSSPVTVCAGVNSGTLSLASERGTILNWESSTDGGSSWSNIINTTANNNFTNLSQTTLYRVQVKNGVCPNGYSDTLQITVDNNTVAGGVTVSTTVCAGSNADTLDAGGFTGSVVEWQFSNDGGFTWLPIANTTTQQAYNNLATTTLFRTLIQNGVCPASNSTPATITVDPAAAAGNIIGGTTVCATANFGSLTLVGYTNTIVDWEESNDGGFSFTPTGSTSPIFNYSGLSATMTYRVIVSSGVCPNDTTDIVDVNVDDATVGGAITIDDTVCAGANNDTLVLGAQTGDVLNWELSTDNGTTWLTLANNTTEQIYNNLLTTSLFRARVQSGVCPATTSAPATITVNPQSDGGVVNSNQAGCEGQNSGVFTLTSNVGTIVNWEFSTDNGATWSIIPGALTSTLNFLNFSDTTLVRANVQSGSCAIDSSSYAIFTAYPKPVAMFASDTACLNTSLSFVNQSTIPNGSVVLNTWDFGDGTSAVLGSPLHQYDTPGTYNVTLVAMSNFLCLDTITFTAVVNPLPDVSVMTSNGTLFCAEDTTTLYAVFNANYDYDWSTGDTTFSTLIDTSISVTLTITDTSTGCINTNIIDVVELPAPTAYAGIDTTINMGESVMLTGSGGGTYMWTPGITLNDSTSSSPLASPLTTTSYILTVTNSSGCTDTDTVNVTVEEVINLVITNLVTPNEDGFNDTWFIQNIDLFPGNSVKVYNRAGQPVFTMDDYDNTWGGTFNGTLLPDGTYYYVITFTDSESVLKGSVNVLRNN